MHTVFGILASAAGIYSILILVRIIVSWFSGFDQGRPAGLLSRITDPYLDWWRHRFSIRIGFLDFSVLLGIAALSIFQNIFYFLSQSNKITVGYILAIVLFSAWSVISFILGFCIIVIVLRMIAYLTNRDIYSPFWKIIDSISQPILYRLNRIFFGNRIANYLKGIILSIVLLGAIWVGGNIVVPKLARLLAGLSL